jgi:hypothetical protein
MDRRNTTEDHVEQLLDQALEATFPASDPVAVSVVTQRRQGEMQAQRRQPKLRS